jgi:hypothetical protein
MMRTLRKKTFSDWRRFSRARVRWTGAEPMDGVLQGLPFLRGHEVEESINTEGPPSFHPKRIFFQCVGSDVVRQRVEILMW